MTGAVRGRGGIGRRNGLERLSARGETRGAELLKFGEPCQMAIPSQALATREGVETRRAAPTASGYGEGIVQTTNGRTAGGESRSGMKIRWG